MEISFPWAASCNGRLAKVIVPLGLINSDSFELPKASKAICNHTEFNMCLKASLTSTLPRGQFTTAMKGCSLLTVERDQSIQWSTRAVWKTKLKYDSKTAVYCI